MHKYQQFIFLLLLLYINLANTIEWEFAVTTKTKIFFLNADFKTVATAAQDFSDMTALELDEAEEVIYFSDKVHTNHSISSLRLSDTHNHVHPFSKVVGRTNGELVSALAYDPLERRLYWTDSLQQKIMYVSIDSSDEPQVYLNLNHTKAKPQGLAIDMCRRKLYWTNVRLPNTSIEVIDMETKENSRLPINLTYSIPSGIVVDQLSDRLYYILIHQGNDFSIYSANLDGSNQTELVHEINQIPQHLAVNPAGIYWTETNSNSVFRSVGGKITSTISFETMPYGIVAHSKYLTNLQKDEHCQEMVKTVMERLNETTQNLKQKEDTFSSVAADYCLNEAQHFLVNGGSKRGQCVCKMGWSGERCESSKCHNYCMNGGICSISSRGEAQCNCHHHYQGARCQEEKCTGYCLNGGECDVTAEGELVCECKEHFSGERCQQNNTEICAVFCRLLQHEPDIEVPDGCYNICSDLARDYNGQYILPSPKLLHPCRNPDTNTNTVLILVSGVVVCLALVLSIVLVLRRVYKPVRPRIKKTFVVRKEATRCADTPLTNRPQLASEQCEITIENCCNMNICETPCFDPKLVQQSLSSFDSDRKMLINPLDDDLY